MEAIMRLLQNSNSCVILIPAVAGEKNRVCQENNVSPKRIRINMTTQN